MESTGLVINTNIIVALYSCDISDVTGMNAEPIKTRPLPADRMLIWAEDDLVSDLERVLLFAFGY